MNTRSEFVVPTRVFDQFQKDGNAFVPLRAAIRAILADPILVSPWTVQGLGMLRCYPFGGTDWRLNVWDSSFRVVPPASDMHDHPWNLYSWIIAGRMYNQRYIGVEEEMPGEVFNFKRIECGPNAMEGFDGKKPDGWAKLGKRRAEVYSAGDVYYQDASEIHSTTFDDGSVTLNYRQRVNGDTATVYFPANYDWVDAAPRLATREEIMRGCKRALFRFGETP
jgi:hypothetical protein